MAASKVRVIKRSQGPNPAEWEAMKPVIERLYKHENKTESEVRNILLEHYSFAVTPKMFKQHISKWKFDKKMKRHEMIFAAWKVKEREDIGKATKVKIRGEELTAVKLEYYFKRRPLSDLEQDELTKEPSTPPDLDYSTPRSSSPENCLGEDTTIENDVALVSKADEGPELALVSIARHTPEPKIDGEVEIYQGNSPKLSSFMADAFKPQGGYLQYEMNPQEVFIARLYDHIRLRASGEILGLERREKFDTTSIMRASGWFDEHLNAAVQFQSNNPSLARHIVTKLSDIVAGEVTGYFPDTVIFEMVEVVHYLQLRNASALQLSFMYSLYDKVSGKLGQFHPLVELLCSMTKGYTSTLSTSLIPTTLDFLNEQPSGSVSLNILLPLFAFQGLRTIDAMPAQLLLHIASPSATRCTQCQTALEQSPFVSQPFRSWAARQYINFLNDIWVEPSVDQSSAWHSIMRSRVWRYTWKYPQMTKRREELQKMPFRHRFWAVAKLCLELVTRIIEGIFLECHNFFPAGDHIRNLILESSKRTGLKEDQIQPLCETEIEASIFDMNMSTVGQDNPEVAQRLRWAFRYWVGQEHCCFL